MSSLKSVFRPRRAALAAGCLLAVLVLTHIPQQFMPPPPEGSYLDKIEHVLAYGAVTLLFLLSLRPPVRLLAPAGVLLALATVGALDELSQPWVNRFASVEDFVADLVGVAAAAGVFLLVIWRRGPIEVESPSVAAEGAAD